MDDLEAMAVVSDAVEPFDSLAQGADLPRPSGAGYENEADRHHVARADFSQEDAVLRARQAPGLVVHGPPGTGKSQSITNMIADALARGERVLVVCQKRAALDVVANNLKKVGLDDQYALIHDATSDREPTIDLIRDQLDRLKSQPDEKADTLAAKRESLSGEIETIEGQLDDLHQSFHMQRGCELSFHEIMVQLVDLQGKAP